VSGETYKKGSKGDVGKAQEISGRKKRVVSAGYQEGLRDCTKHT